MQQQRLCVHAAGIAVGGGHPAARSPGEQKGVLRCMMHICSPVDCVNGAHLPTWAAIHLIIKKTEIKNRHHIFALAPHPCQSAARVYINHLHRINRNGRTHPSQPIDERTRVHSRQRQPRPSRRRHVHRNQPRAARRRLGKHFRPSGQGREARPPEAEETPGEERGETSNQRACLIRAAERWCELI